MLYFLCNLCTLHFYCVVLLVSYLYTYHQSLIHYLLIILIQPVTPHILVHLIEQASRSIPMYHRIVRNLFGALWRGSSVINDQTLCKEFVILHIDIVFWWVYHIGINNTAILPHGLTLCLMDRNTCLMSKICLVSDASRLMPRVLCLTSDASYVNNTGIL